jgi:hypothetical protein
MIDVPRQTLGHGCIQELASFNLRIQPQFCSDFRNAIQIAHSSNCPIRTRLFSSIASALHCGGEG